LASRDRDIGDEVLRLGIAVLAATLVPVVASYCVFFAGFSGPMYFLVGSIFSGAIVIFLGLPVYGLLYKFNLLRWWAVLAAGFATGALLMLALSTLEGTYMYQAKLAMMAIFGALGSLSALTLWLAHRALLRQSGVSVQ